MKANAEIVALAGSNFEEVTALVEGLQTGWRDSHPNVWTSQLLKALPVLVAC
jgi:hypothetical protein